MANVTGIRWDPDLGTRGFDVHLLWNSDAFPLNEMLWLDLDSGPGHGIYANQATGASKPANLQSITFSSNINPANAKITLNANTGKITFNQANAPAIPLRNLIVQVEVTRTGGAPTLTKRIRVHIHNKIIKLWLTPATLQVPLEAESYRFTVLAEFDDGVVGDISHWPPPKKPTPDADDKNCLTWTSNSAAALKVEDKSRGNNGLLTAQTAGQTVTVTVAYPHSVFALQATASVTTVPAWKSARTIQYIGGKGKEGAFEDGAPNVLFIPDGITETEKPQFEQYVKDLVFQLTKRPTCRPFDHLGDSIRYWMVWLKSQDAGTTFLAEVTALERGRPRHLRGVPLPQPSTATAGAWTVDRLFNTVGLPVPKDDPLTGVTEARRKTKIAFWNGMYGANLIADVDLALYREWCSYSNRRLLDERDTALGLAQGERPRLEQYSDYSMLMLNPRRANRKDLYQLLLNLEYKPSPTAPVKKVGESWVSQGGANKKKGPDEGLVCIIGRSEMDGGCQVCSPPDYGNGCYFTMTMEGKESLSLQVEPFEVTNKAGIKVLPFTTRKIEAGPGSGTTRIGARIISVTTCAHECSHTFGLLDEYGGGAGRALPASSIKELEKVGHLQPRTELETAGTLSEAKLRKIKWNWPRLAKAGVLKEGPFAQAIVGDQGSRSPLVMTMGLQHGARFRAGDVVQLRWRDLDEKKRKVDSTELGENDRFSPLFQIDTITLERGAGLYRIKLKHLEGSSAADQSKALAALLNFKTGDLLVCPVLDKDKKPVPLISPTILDHIATTKGPLDAPKGNPGRPCQPNPRHDRYVNPTNLPESYWDFVDPDSPLLLKGPRIKATLVGLYEGGKGYDCGVYHPAGTCTMRRAGHARDYKQHPFCHVCRYLLVERIDVSKHWEINQDYEEEYPEL